MKERIQKIISASGLASRRAGEEMLRNGRVTVNGVRAGLGDSADPDTDVICVDGTELRRTAEHTYIMLNKPRGYVTTLSDEKGRKCVSELVKDTGKRLYPVGRLDMYSEGLLIMTDDGELANRLMHPSSETVKTYHIWADGEVSAEKLSALRTPIILDGYKIKPPRVEVLRNASDYSMLSVEIHEGRNRQIRRMCENAGIKLTRLRRVGEGGLSLGELPVGKWRYISKEEMQELLNNHL